MLLHIDTVFRKSDHLIKLMDLIADTMILFDLKLYENNMTLYQTTYIIIL